MRGQAVYRSWDDVPTTLATKTQLGQDGLRPAINQPIIAYKRGLRGELYALYERAAAVAKRPATPAQLAALAKARAVVCVGCGGAPGVVGALVEGKCLKCRKEAWQRLLAEGESNAAAAWAREVLASDALILDTETTGLDDSAEILEIGIIDMAGTVLWNGRLRPVATSWPDAQMIHGIAPADVVGAPTLPVVYERLAALLSWRRVVIYNAVYDLRLLAQSCAAWSLASIAVQADCAMQQYTTFCQAARWVRLPGGDHSALGDCRAVLRVLQEMAA